MPRAPPLAAVPPAAFGVETLGYERPPALIMRGVYNCCVKAIVHGVLPSDDEGWVV